MQGRKPGKKAFLPCWIKNAFLSKMWIENLSGLLSAYFIDVLGQPGNPSSSCFFLDNALVCRSIYYGFGSFKFY
jgi:hypothetical protein